MSTVTLMTAEQFALLPGAEQCELIAGEIKRMSPPGIRHGGIAFRIAYLLGQSVVPRQLGEILVCDSGFIIARDPDTVRGPDVAFISADRASAVLPEGFWPGAPDLAVEVVSPSDTLQDVEEKVDDWLNGGTRLVWIVNPKRRTVTIHRPGADVRLLNERDELSGEDVTPGFACKVGEIFA